MLVLKKYKCSRRRNIEKTEEGRLQDTVRVRKNLGKQKLSGSEGGKGLLKIQRPER